MPCQWNGESTYLCHGYHSREHGGLEEGGVGWVDRLCEYLPWAKGIIYGGVFDYEDTGANAFEEWALVDWYNFMLWDYCQGGEEFGGFVLGFLGRRWNIGLAALGNGSGICLNYPGFMEYYTEDDGKGNLWVGTC
jgi:hypothetical protein